MRLPLAARLTSPAARTSLFYSTLFVTPAIRAMLGYREPGPRVRALKLENDLRANHDRPTYHPAALEGDGVRALPWLGSADLRSLAGVGAFVVLPPGPVGYAAGDAVNTLILE